MAETTAISWAKRTWSPWIGCQKTGSPACEGCYAEALMDTRYGRVNWGPHGERVRTSPDYWRQLRRWNAQAEAAGERTSSFPSLCDPFDNKANPSWRAEWFDEIRATPWIDHLLLTKRPQNIERQLEEISLPKNVRLGVTAVTPDEVRRDCLAMARAAGRKGAELWFLSAEPLTMRIGEALRPFLRERWECRNCRRILERWETAERLGRRECGDCMRVGGLVGQLTRLPACGWVISGGASDQPGWEAPPTHPSVFRDLRDVCAETPTPYHHKQHGSWAPICWMSEDLTESLYHKAPRRDPEARRRCKVESVVMDADGVVRPHSDPLAFRPPEPMTMFHVGVKRAGRLIDGVLHDARPEARHG